MHIARNSYRLGTYQNMIFWQKQCSSSSKMIKCFVLFVHDLRYKRQVIHTLINSCPLLLWPGIQLQNQNVVAVGLGTTV